MNWEKRGTATSIEEAIRQNSGMTDEELLNPQYVEPDTIENLRDAADVIMDTLQYGYPIAIFGDYDVDGITSSSILFRLFRHLGATVACRLPRRFSEGYGMSTAAIDEIADKNTLIVTVDNGITAIEQIAYAREKGFSIVVIDHHLPDATLPNADVIVNPHVNPENNGYVDYCGAGLALKLAEMMLGDELQYKPSNKEEVEHLLDQLTILATIGTIADVMPLTGDNRRIVKRGLELLKRYDICELTGLRALIECCEMYSRTEHDIAFKIAPILNAPGRLQDDGAMKSFNLVMADLFMPDYQEALKAAAELVLINENRKDAVAAAMDEAIDYIADECLYGTSPLCVCLQEANEGIIGIVAGKLAEQMKVPTFVFTYTSEAGILKGSGRSYGNINLKEMVNAASKYIEQSGGHEGAAGVMVKTDNFFDMVHAMEKYAADHVEVVDSDVLYYDVEVKPNEVASCFRTLEKYAPFGEGNPSPVSQVKKLTK